MLARQEKTAVRLGVCLALVVLGVIFAIGFRLPAHLVLQTGDNAYPVGPITPRAAFVQELNITGPMRIASLEVLLATWGKPTNATHDEIRIFDGDGRQVQAMKLPPGSVADNAYVRVDLRKPLEIDGQGRFFVSLSSSDGSKADSITAWATAASEAGRLYSLPSADLGHGSLVEKIDQARPLEGAICVRVLGQGPRRLLAEKALRVGGLLVFLALAACVLWAQAVRRWVTAARDALNERWKRVEERFARSRLSRPGRRLSEEHLIRFGLKTQLFCALGLLLFVGLVAFKIHGSSIEMWNQYLPSDRAGITDASLIAGRPKAIRSDEWLVSTPKLLHDYVDPAGQTSSGKAIDVVSPWNWGFHVLGLERGFSFMWDFWVLGSIYGFFFLVMLLTGNNFRVSVFSSLFLFFSSYNRWWDISVYVTTFSVVLVCLICFLQSRKRLNIWLSFVLLCVFGLKFVLNLYPAWQVTLVYLMLFILAGSLLQKGSLGNLRVHLWTKVALATVGLVGAAGAGALAYTINREVIEAMSATVYPGKRVSVGGDVGIFQFFSGYLDPLLGSILNQDRFFMGNICESAAFILLFPFVIVAVLLEKWFSRGRRVKPVVLALIAYLVALSVYMLLGYGSLLSRALLLNYVPGNRALIGLGLASILLVAVYVAEPPSGRVPLWAKGMLAALALCGLTAFAIGFQGRYGYPNWVAALPVCVALAVAIGAMMTRARVLFYVIMLLLVAMPSLNSNPISVGLEPIYGKRLVQAVMRIAAGNPGERWLVYGDLASPEIVRAAGADVFNGVRFPPEVATMRELDPTGAHAEVWNRFAHIQAVPGQPGATGFKLDYTDAYTMAVSPQEPALAAAHVGLFVVPTSMQGMFPRPAFRKLTASALNGYLIFERARQ